MAWVVEHGLVVAPLRAVPLDAELPRAAPFPDESEGA
jgi:hypothetical protein